MRLNGDEAGRFPAFRDEVWREIRHRIALGEHRQDGWVEPVWLSCIRSLFPHAAVAGLAVAVISAWAVAMVWTMPALSDRTATTSRVLDLDVFESHADGLATRNLIVNR